MESVGLLGLFLCAVGFLLIGIYTWNWASIDRLGFTNAWPFFIIRNTEMLHRWGSILEFGLILTVPGVLCSLFFALYSGNWSMIRGLIAATSLILVVEGTWLFFVARYRATREHFPDDLRAQYARISGGLAVLVLAGLLVFSLLFRTL